ncbi:MAG: methylmalonyl-CoA epimerase [candidate division Zixibacteria bacterium]|nr:methylmalonyl-CoA epimerase [candidate division Zixibacteria bacterium]
MKISHIAIAVNDLEQAKGLFSRLLGTKADDTIEIPDQQVRVCFLQSEGTRIELIAPMAGNTSLQKFLESRGEGLHHLAIEVDDIKKALQEYRQAGIRLIDETPRIGATGAKIAFLHPSACGGVLIELEEQK